MRSRSPHTLRRACDLEVIDMAEASTDRSLDRRLVAHRTVAWQHGIIGGLAAGVLMGLLLSVAMAITGDGFLRPLELIGSVWYGAFTTGATVIVIGLATHLALSVVFGAIWAYAFSYIKVEPLLSGLAFGAILWVAMRYVVLPIAGDFLLGGTSGWQFFPFGVVKGEAVSGFAAWMVPAAYLLFGLSLGAYEQWADRRKVRG